MKIKKILCLLTSVVIAASAFAVNTYAYYYDGTYDAFVNARKANDGNFTYILKDYAQYGSVNINNAATVVDIPNIQKVEIPEKVTYNGTEFTVTDLSLSEEPASSSYNKVEEIVLPETIYNISDVYGFKTLKKMNLPKNAMIDREKDIQNGNLVYLNKGFNDTVHFYYFENCPNLKLLVDIDNPYYSYKNDMLLSKDGKKVYMAFNNSTDLIIPDGVEEILDYGGIGFKHIKNIKLPNTLKRLYAMFSSVNEISLPNQLEELSGCFKANTKITKISLPNSLKKIGANTFYKTTKLTKIVIPDSVKEISDKAFANSNLKSVKFGRNLTTIGQRAFSNCKKLKSVAIHKNVKKINERAFENCTALNKVNILSSNVDIVFNAFSNCKKLRIVTINGVKKIDLKAFENCKKLSKVTIKNKKRAPKIVENAFKNTKKGLKFAVKNKKVAKQLKKQLIKKNSGVRNAKILIGKKIVYQNIKG